MGDTRVYENVRDKHKRGKRNKGMLSLRFPSVSGNLKPPSAEAERAPRQLPESSWRVDFWARS